MIADSHEYSRDQTTSGTIVTEFDTNVTEETCSRKPREIPTYRASVIAAMACVSVWGLGCFLNLESFERAPSLPESRLVNKYILGGWKRQPFWLIRVICGRYPSGES